MRQLASIAVFSAFGLIAGAPVLAQSAEEGWRIQLDATRSGLVDAARLTLGGSSIAETGFDLSDDPHPPTLPSRYLDLVTRHAQSQPGWETQPLADLAYRAESIGPLGPTGHVFSIDLDADAPGAVTLSWRITPNLELARYFIALRDAVTGAVVDMWATTTVNLNVTPGSRLLRIELTPGRVPPPVAYDDAATATEDTPLPLVLDAQDADGASLAYSIVSPAAHGTLLGAPPNLTYVPNPDFNGADQFTFKANNGRADSNVATVSLTVTPVNDAPAAHGQSVQTSEDVPVAIALQGSDVDGDALIFSIVTPPAHGTLSGPGQNVSYAPAPEFSGGDSFTFLATDGALASAPATVALSVAAVNDPPSPAFSVPGPARNAAGLANNLASYLEGASIAAASSQQGGAALSAIDENVQTQWVTGFGLTTNQSLTVALPRETVLDRIRLVNGTTGQAVNRFEVRVSTTTSDLSAFATVLSGVAADSSAIQEYPLAARTPARFVQLVALDNHGSTCCVAVRSFEAVSDSLAGIPTYDALPANVASVSEGASATATSQYSEAFKAALAIDGLTGTRWASGSGQPLGQSLTIALARGRSYRIDRLRIWNAFGAAGQQVRDFRVSASSTTPDDAAFTTLLTGTLQDVGTAQEFVFPGGAVDARYVRLTPLTNYGSTCCSSVADLEIPPIGSQPVSVSSYADSFYRPDLAIDGIANTAWRTKGVSGQFLEVRLDGDVLIDRVRLLSEVTNMAPKDFDVLVSSRSDDDADFSLVLQGTYANNGKLQEFAFTGGPRRARYVRLVPRNNYGASEGINIASFEVVSVASEGSLVSANATLLSSSSPLGGTTGPAAALDADPAVPGWVSSAGQTQWLTLALPAQRTWLIDHVALQPRPDCCSPRSFEVQVSTTTADAAAFQTVLAGTLRNNGATQHFFFAATEARYVRLLLVDNYGAAQNHLLSFAIYSPEIGALAARFEDRSTDVDSAIASRGWEFGDGAVSGDQHPAHVYSNPGHYEVTLTATDDAGAGASRTQPYEAVGSPQATFSVAPANPDEGASVSFTDASVDPVGVVLRDWDFGDGKPHVVGASANATHSFDNDGSYHVTLRVTNSWGVTSSAVRTVAVRNLAPIANAGADKKVLLGQDWGVFPTVSDPGAADVPSLACRWDFGDGQATEISNCGSPGTARVAHVYTAAGSYTATLTVTDSSGASAADSVKVSAYPPECVLGQNVFLEFPWCGNSYSIMDLGSVPTLPLWSYGGVIVDREDPDRLLLATRAIAAEGAIHAVGLVRDADRHIIGFSGEPTKVATVPYIDGGMAYGPEGVLFTAAWPSQQLIQLKPGSSAPDKVIELVSLGVNDVGLNFVPRGFPGACSLKFVRYFDGRWWSSAIAPDGSGTYSVTPGQLKQPVFSGGPEHLLYVPEGSTVFPDRSTVLVTEWASNNIVAYAIDANGDPIPSTRQVFISGFPSPEALAIDPLTGDLLVTNLLGFTVKRIRGLQPPVWRLDLAPASASKDVSATHTVTATVREPRAGVRITFSVTGGPNAGATGVCSPKADCTTDANGVVQFSYVGSGGGGVDSIQASLEAATCDTMRSPAVGVEWIGNRAPVAEAGSVVTDEDVPATITLTAADPDGDALNYEIVTAPQHGSMSGSGASMTYTPAPNYNGPDSLRFVARDAQSASEEATVAITVRPVNDVPVAQGLTTSTLQTTPVAIPLAASDVDGDSLTYAIVSAPLHGSLSGTAPDLVYTPAPGFAGTDAFTFQASDGVATSNLAAVSIDVIPNNHAPVAHDGSAMTTEDAPVDVGLVAEDSDLDALQYTIVTPPVHGTLSGAAPNLVYTPAPDEHGPDTFVFQASDGQVDSNLATFTIEVQPINDAPVAADQSLQVTQAQPASVALTATDVDGDALTYTLVTAPAHGSVRGIAPNLTFTSDAGYVGADSFTFLVSDGQADSNVASVSLLVVSEQNHAPDCSQARATLAASWPPNHKMVAVEISGVTDDDGDAPAVLAKAIRQDEPVDGLGDGDRSPDATLTPLQVRLERSGTGNGRVYHIAFEASDGDGASCTGTATVCVPHDLEAPSCTDDGAQYDSTRAAVQR